jgi:hypothetical protein
VKMRLAVIALLVLASSAAFAQGTFTFGFLSADAEFEYCNYEFFATGGLDNFYLTGYDVLDLCPAPANPASPIVGFGIQTPVAALAPVNGGGIYVYADAIEDAYFNAYTGIQLTSLTKTKIGKIRYGNYGWALYVGFGAFSFLDNWGFLTDAVPAAPNSLPMTKSTVYVGSKDTAQGSANKLVLMNKSYQ